jgi:hypothetical protein
MFFGSIVWWWHDDSWPTSVVRVPELDYLDKFFESHRSDGIVLSLQLVFIYILTLSGLVSSLALIGGLVRSDNTTPRNRWLYVVCGVITCASGLLSGPPILISPESAAGIKAGAKTGLSTIVCGLLFGVSVFFGPILENVPNAATAPLLIAVGIVLFQNVQKLNWKLITDSTPAYVVLFFIPFTYSILQGVVIGFIVYLTLGVLTGQILYSGLDLWLFYFESSPLEYFCSKFSPDESTIAVTLTSMSSSVPAPAELKLASMSFRAPSVAELAMDGLEAPSVLLNVGLSDLMGEVPAFFPTAETFKQYQDTHKPNDENL